MGDGPHYNFPELIAGLPDTHNVDLPPDGPTTASCRSPSKQPQQAATASRPAYQAAHSKQRAVGGGWEPQLRRQQVAIW